MPDIEKLDDPIWEYVLATKLTQYIPAVQEFWNKVEDITIVGTGVYPITKKLVSCDIPPGLMYRVTNTPVRSPIKGVQVFPFVPATYLQLTNVTGGANRMVQRVCAGYNFTLEGFTIVEKSNLPSTYNQGQFIAFVPTDIINGLENIGKWVYMKHDEMLAVLQADVPARLKQKLIRYV